MSNKMIKVLVLIFAAILLLALIYLAVYFARQAAIPLDEAQKHYAEGIQAANIVEREIFFNKALAIYHQLEEQYNPIHGNGKLYNNIAQTYSQLEQFPRSAYYFYQAHALRPRDEEVADNLMKTLAVMNIKQSADDSIFKSVFFFHYYLSLPERLMILFFSVILAFIFASLYLWKNYRFLKSFIACVLLVSFIFLGSVLYTKYIESLEGVFVLPSMLFSDSDNKSKYVDQKPLMGGSKIEVLDVDKKGEWLKVRTSDGKIGYVPSTAVGLIKL